MNNRTATVKVGLLTMISLVVLITTVIWLRGRSLGGGQGYEVFFQDVDGLRQGAPVQFMGIRVGFVDDVTPMMLDTKHYRVRIKFTVTDPTVKLPRGSYISLQQSGIIGEKFVEVTPPRSEIYDLILDRQTDALQKQMPIKVAFRDKLLTIGAVQEVQVTEVAKIVRKSPDYRYRIRYLVNSPGYMPPSVREFEMVTPDSEASYLLLQDNVAALQPSPSPDAYFTLEEPLRLKGFLEQQLASAEALKITNEKINQLLSDEAISSIQGTLKNSEMLTAQATKVLGEMDTLFESTSHDLRVLVASAQELTTSVVAVSNNLNDVAGNPEIKANIAKTVKSVEESTSALSTLLQDSDLKNVLADAKETSRNASDLMQYLKTTAVDNDLNGRLNTSLTLLESSLTRLSSTMESLDAISDDKESIKGIITNTKETTDNLNRFSERLNKRFLLFRLLF